MSSFNLSAWAIRHQALVLFMIIASVAVGAYAYMRLGRAEDPQFTIRTMVVTAQWPGATAKEMQAQVTDRIEQALQQVPNFYHTRTYARPGETVIFVNLQDYTRSSVVPDLWYQVRKKVGDIANTLPQGVIGPQFNDEFGDTYGNIYAFSGDGFSDVEMHQVLLAARQRLLRLPAVGKVDLLGLLDERIYVEFDTGRLAEFGVTIQQVANALAAQNAVSPTGLVDTGAERIRVRVTGALSTEEQVRTVPIQANGRLLRLGDIAAVRRGVEDPPSTLMRHNGERVTGLAISMAAGGDILKLGEALEAEIATIQSTLPVGIEIEKIADQPTVVKDSIDEFIKALAEALAIVLVVTFISLGMRTGIVVALSVPLVLAITFAVMLAAGIDLHKISIGALVIALGLLVDDAIIAVEMMMVKLEQGWDRARAAAFAWTSTAFPMLTGTLVTAAGFVPVGFAHSAAGEYTGAIFWVVATALLVSWFVAVIFTPYVGFKLLPTPHEGAASHDPAEAQAAAYDKPIYRRLRASLIWTVNHRWIVIALTIAAFGASVFGFGFVQQQFFPNSARLELVVDIELPEGTAIGATQARVKEMEALFAKEPAIISQTAFVGGGAPRFYMPLNQELNRPNFAQFILMTGSLDDTKRLAKSLPPQLESLFPEFRTRVARLENGPPVGYPIQFRVLGRDPEVIRQIAGDLRDLIRTNPHTIDVNFDWNEKIKSVRLVVDQDRARALGISSQDLAMAMQTVLTGYTATQYREGIELIDVVLRAGENERQAVDRLGDIRLRGANGTALALSQIARIEYGLEEGILWTRSRDLTMTVRADLIGDIQAPTVAAQIQAAMGPLVAKLPTGYRIDLGGAVEESAKGQNSIMAVVPAMILIMLVVLMVQLQSFQRVILVFLTAPLGLIGVTLALLIFNQPFGFVAQLGVIALAGMIMRNSVILVDQIEQDIAAGHGRFDAVVDATVRRARPIMLTAAAAVLAMIPLSRSTFWGPMALSIMGGLIVATALTIYSLPAMYAAWFKVRREESGHTAPGGIFNQP
ncbi:efflux RND transporter permease subunit [Niveispirillum irakense]|uniref:efflux RND transporter permease subunit n=1 Tax=Niveispirillum irakense TaxID=34011 RepID=UPI00040D9E6F|nr:efflux RND transporter permease subunit [Niveispirillum irakense]